MELNLTKHLSARVAAPRKAWSRPTVTIAAVAQITASTPFGAENDGNIASAASPYS